MAQEMLVTPVAWPGSSWLLAENISLYMAISNRVLVQAPSECRHGLFSGFW